MGYVYIITNTVNGKSYIGISIHEPTQGRIKDHLSGKGNRLIANAVKKYGNQDAFTYEILEANVFDELLPDLEVAYIAQFNTLSPHGYNLDSGGSHKIPSEETRRKISKAHKGRKHSVESRRNMSEARKGRIFSVETRRKIGEAHKGEKNHNFGKTLSPEHRRKISESIKGEKHPNFGKRGKKQSAETRRKISESIKGEKHPNFGKKHSTETLRKMSEIKKGKRHSAEARRKMSEARKGEKNHNFGKSPSTETRRKMSEAKKGKKQSAEHVRKRVEANRLPEYVPAHDFFLSLPADMPLKEKRKLLFANFPSVTKRIIYKWVRKWSS